MPELPEVFTISKNLQEILPNSTLIQTEIFEDYRSIPKFEAFEELKQQKVVSVDRVAKYIIISFESKKLIIHLGMTGRIRYSKQKELFKWDKLRFNFLSADGETYFINFTDTRKFGKVKISNSATINSGIEPFNLDEHKVKTLKEKIQKRNSEIKNILLDQQVIAGLGNIYSNDTLFEAKINPLIKGKDLNDIEVEKIIQAANKVLLEGINKKGSSMKDKMYTDIYGNYGEYQDSFKVYEKKECILCQSKIIKIHIKGRSSYYCPKCQPIKI